MAQIFTMNKSDLRKLERFFKRSPKQFKAATANILNSLAFTTMNYDKMNLKRHLIIRSDSFLKKSLKVVMAKGSREINQQIAIAGSVNIKRGTGWAEQEYGSPPRRRRTNTKYARKTKRSTMLGRARLKSGKQFHKPQDFQARSNVGRFYSMIKFIKANKGGEFILSDSIRTNRSTYNPGLYEYRKGKIHRLQKFARFQPKRVRWRTMSLQRLMSKNNIRNIWMNSLRHIVNRYK